MSSHVKLIFDRKKRATDEKEGNIEVSVSIGGGRSYFNTGVKLLPYQWQHGMVVNHPEQSLLNKQLADISSKCDKIIFMMELNNDPMTIEKFKSYMDNGKRTKRNFMVWIEQRINERNIAEGTRKGHLTLFGALRRFGRIRSFDHLTLEKIYAFDLFLREEKDAVTKQPIQRSQSAIHNYHKRLKSYVNEAFRLGLIRENPYDRFVDKRGEGSQRPHLTKEQVIRLQKMREETSDPDTSMYLDFFLFQIFTGMAFSDAQRFNYCQHVVEINGYKYIDGHRVKTGGNFIVPILPYTEKILARTNNKPVIVSLQKYNQFLKGVGLALGCKYPISSHVGRHTFACTIILGEGVPKEVLQVMMGHSSIKTTEIYAKLPIDFITRNVSQHLLDTWT